MVQFKKKSTGLKLNFVNFGQKLVQIRALYNRQVTF